MTTFFESEEFNRPPRPRYLDPRPPRSTWFWVCTIGICCILGLTICGLVAVFVLDVTGAFPSAAPAPLIANVVPFNTGNSIVAPTVSVNQRNVNLGEVNSVPVPTPVPYAPPLTTLPYLKITGSEGLQTEPSVAVSGASGKISFKMEAGSMELLQGYIYASGPIVTNSRFGSPSDLRIKKNIENILPQTCLSLLRQLQPKTYQYQQEWLDLNPALADHLNSTNNMVDVGFIAQDLEKLVPFAVSSMYSSVFSEFMHDNQQETLKVVDKSMLMPIVVGAIKDIDTRLNQVERKLQILFDLLQQK